MKFKSIILYGIALCYVCVSCNKFVDVNTDPNNPQKVPLRTLLPTATMGVAFANSNVLGKVAAHLVQYSAGISNTAYTFDQWNIGSLDNQWNGEVYGNSLVNLEIMIKQADSTRSPAYSGIAKLQKAYLMSIATDVWGDVPYSQAGQSLLFPTPRFDAQKDIYFGNSSSNITSLFNLVRSGLVDLSQPLSASVYKPGNDDVIYGADTSTMLAKWTRVGNTLLLKLALQVSNVAPDTTKSVISAIINSNAPIINDASYDLKIPYTAANPNAYYVQDFVGSIPGTQMLSSRFLTLMRAQNDSLRLSKFFTKPAATFIGYDNGSPFAAPATNTRSVYGTYVVGTKGEAPVRLLTSFQTAFILAEATLSYGVSGDPNAYYQLGIKQSMKAAGLADADINAYFNANPSIVTLSGSNTDKLKQIITQKYISLVGNAIESYNDYRRTGYPVLTPPLTTTGDDPNVLPKRYPYTNSEGNANPNQPNPRPSTSVKVWWGM